MHVPALRGQVRLKINGIRKIVTTTGSVKVMTGSEDKGSQSPRDDFPGKLERMLRADPLLAPYFEKGALHVIDRPGGGPPPDRSHTRGGGAGVRQGAVNKSLKNLDFGWLNRYY